MSEIEGGFIAEVVCPYCGRKTLGNVAAKPKNNSIYSYSRCPHCDRQFRTERFPSGVWCVDSWCHS